MGPQRGLSRYKCAPLSSILKIQLLLAYPMFSRHIIIDFMEANNPKKLTKIRTSNDQFIQPYHPIQPLKLGTGFSNFYPALDPSVTLPRMDFFCPLINYDKFYGTCIEIHCPP